MKLITGAALNPTQRAAVKATFVHRWTIENAIQTYGGQCPGCVQRTRSGGSPLIEVGGNLIPWHGYHVALVTDTEWIAAHAFWFTKGGDLARNRRHAEPASLAGLIG